MLASRYKNARQPHALGGGGGSGSPHKATIEYRLQLYCILAAALYPATAAAGSASVNHMCQCVRGQRTRVPPRSGPAHTRRVHDSGEVVVFLFSSSHGQFCGDIQEHNLEYSLIE